MPNRGDFDCNGNVFWSVQKGFIPKDKFDRWMLKTKEYQLKKMNKLRSLGIRGTIKRGATRDDGLVFWGFSPSTVGNQIWVDRETFQRKASAESVQRKNKRALNKLRERILKHGDIRNDGMVFWRYCGTSKNGEHWVTPDKFTEMKNKQSAFNKEKRKRNKEWAKACNRKCAANNRKRIRTDPEFRARRFLRERLKSCVKRLLCSDQAMAVCKRQEAESGRFLVWLADKLGIDALSGKFHIDHLVPISKFKEGNYPYLVNSPENVRWLTAFENLQKNARMPDRNEIDTHLAFVAEWRAKQADKI